MLFVVKSKHLLHGTCILLYIILMTKAVSECNNKMGENETTPCGGSGSFINLCGLCVGGETGRLATEGMDSCKVCGGDNSCVGCDNVLGSNKISDACGACLELDDEMRDRCIRISSVYPMILDRAVEKVATVNLRGAGISPSNLPYISCSLEPTNPQQQGDKAQKIEKLSVEDDVIQLEVILIEYLGGLYTVNCSSNTLGPVASRSQLALLIVDSRQLCVTDYRPRNVSVGVEFQMELTIPAVVQNSSVLCYVQRKGQQTAEVLQAAEVATGHVKCRPYITRTASRMEWGAAYTWDAAIDMESCPSPVELIAVAPAPVMQLAKFYDGVRKVRIEFDHNVDGSEKCSDIFPLETLALLGYGANCSYVANSLIVSLGSNPKVQGNSELQLLDNSKVFQEQSDLSLTTAASGKVILTPPDPKTSTPQFEVEAPRLICPDAQLGSALGHKSVVLNASSTSTGTSTPQVIRILSSTGQKLEYNWTLDFSAKPKDQRHNLMIWQSVRMLHNYLQKSSGSAQSNQILVNTSMLMAGIEYKVSVNGVNMLGIQGETQRFSFQVMPDAKKSDSEAGISSSQLLLKGPTVTLSSAVSFIEATFVSCIPQIMRPNLKYQWEIEGELAEKVELPRGKRLCLHSGILQGGKVYNISCTCTSQSNEYGGLINLNAWRAVIVISRGIKACITKQEMVIGTGQMLQLDASQSQDLDRAPGVLQFLWCCRRETGERCLLPGAGEPVTLESAFENEFQQPVLTIPPRSLPVGRYIFTVEVSKHGASSEAQATVIIVPGMPAVVNIPVGAHLNVVNPKEGVTIPAVVMNTREGCYMWWSVQQEPGHEYFNLAEVVGLGDTIHVTLEEAKDVLGREFPLVIPGPTGTWPGLKDNAVYKLRLSVVCPAEPVESYTDILVTTNSPPIVKPLKVIPLEGEALRSRFMFSTDLADDSSADYPLLYRYGYRISDQEQVNIFGTSNVDLQADTILPAVAGPKTVIFPVLTVCDVHELCTTVTGEQVSVTLPSNFTLMEVQQIGVQFADYVASEQYPEALSIAQTSLQTLKQLPDQTAYTAGAEIIETEIKKDLKRKQDGLGANLGSLQSSLDFLDMSIRILSELPISGSTLQDLSAFKDNILRIAKHSGELKLKYNSFPDRHSSSGKQSRQRRSNGNTPPAPTLSLNSVKSLLQVSETLIKTGNSSVVLEEKASLLQDLSTYMYHLCLGKDQKIPVGSSVVHFSVQKLLSKDQIMKTTNFSIPDRLKLPPAVNETGLIYLGQTVAEKYGPSGKTCLGAAVFPADYLTDVAMGKSELPVKAQERNSMVFEVQLVITERGLPPPGKLDYPITFKIPVYNTTLQADEISECATWSENMWTADSCATVKSVTLSSQMYLVCNCTVLGYYTVIVTNGYTTRRVPTTVETRVSTDTTTENMHDSPSVASTLPQSSQTTSCSNLSPSDRQQGVPISSEAYSISFRIEEDFSSTVGKQKGQFEQKLRCEILALGLQIPARMIQGIDVSPGSIIVTMKLVDTDVKTAKEVIPAIAQIIQNGDLNLHDLSNRKLNVPAQTVTIIEPYRPDKSNVVVYAVVGSVIMSTLGIVSLVTGAVIIKRKKDTDKLRKPPLPAVKDGIPSYRQFQFEQSIEGTEASLARYRSNYPTMSTAGTLMLGVNCGARYELEVTDSQYLHPDISCTASQVNGRKKKKNKKKQRQGVKQTGSQNGLLNQQGTPPGDQDSGIVDGCTNVSEDRKIIKRRRGKLNSDDSAMEFYILPGTPNEDS